MSGLAADFSAFFDEFFDTFFDAFLEAFLLALSEAFLLAFFDEFIELDALDESKQSDELKLFDEFLELFLDIIMSSLFKDFIIIMEDLNNNIQRLFKSCLKVSDT